MGEQRYLIAFSRLLASKKAVAEVLLNHYGSAKSVFQADFEQRNKEFPFLRELFQKANLSELLEQADHELEFMEKHHIQALFISDPNYPKRLKECIDAPLILYYRGEPILDSARILSIVGTRHATAYGKSFCETMMRDLAQLDKHILIVSGLAYGVDITAHQTAMKNGLKTVAILGHGLNTIYPAVHRNTARQMLEAGGLLTEYTSRASIHPGNFIARNRIIAGLSDATIIVESANKGGSLITADIAESYHREVFALPGRIEDKFSQGCNRIIAENRAILLRSVDDVFTQLGWELHQKKPIQQQLFHQLNNLEQQLLTQITQNGEMQINQLCICMNLPIEQISALLLEMEFKGLVRPFPGGRYRII